MKRLVVAIFVITACIVPALADVVQQEPETQLLGMDSRRAEAESIFGSTVTQFRALYAKTGEAPKADSKEAKAVLNLAVGEYTERTTYITSSKSTQRNPVGIIVCYMSDYTDGVHVGEFVFRTGTTVKLWIGEGDPIKRKKKADDVGAYLIQTARAAYAKTGTMPDSDDGAIVDASEKQSTNSAIRLISYQPLENKQGLVNVYMANPDDGILQKTFDFKTGIAESKWTKYGEVKDPVVVVVTDTRDGRRVQAARAIGKIRKQLIALFKKNNTRPTADSETVKSILDKAAKNKAIESVSYETVVNDQETDNSKCGKVTIVMAKKSDGKLICVFNYLNNDIDVDWEKGVASDGEPTEAEVDDEPMAFYRTVGNFSLTKTTMKMKMGDDWKDFPATFTRMQITKVNGDDITYKMTTYDAGMKETYSSEQTLDLAPREAAPEGIEPPETTAEEIEVKAGKFKCNKTVTDGGMETSIWMYKGLVVKTQSKSDTMDFSTELQEYKFN